MHGAKLCSVLSQIVELHGFIQIQIGSSLFFYVVYLKVFFFPESIGGYILQYPNTKCWVCRTMNSNHDCLLLFITTITIYLYPAIHPTRVKDKELTSS